MKRNILVVDDEPQTRELVCFYLSKQGYHAVQATSFQDTVQVLDTQMIDLVVLDIALGGEDGLGLLPRIKVEHPGTKVVMLTGMGFVEDLLEEAQQKGADGYVSKLLPLGELQLAVQKALRNGRAEMVGTN
jgi:DNA-binding response OmpR family regulator